MTYSLFLHLFHIVAGYLLARGLKIGVYLAFAVSMYEIVAFIIPGVDYEAWFSADGLFIRVLFAATLILIAMGRKDYQKLSLEKGRSWKNLCRV